VSDFSLSPRAESRLNEIYEYGLVQWGAERVDRYLDDLYECFKQIARDEVWSAPIAAELGVDGFYRRQGSHFVYWKRLGDGSVGIVTILHKRMHQMERFKDESA
jgi:plasmid stabilization system protein ParE